MSELRDEVAKVLADALARGHGGVRPVPADEYMARTIAPEVEALIERKMAEARAAGAADLLAAVEPKSVALAEAIDRAHEVLRDAQTVRRTWERGSERPKP